MRRVAIWSFAWIGAAALYLLLIDTTDVPELVVGAIAAAIAASAFALGREQYVVGEAVKARWFVNAWRPVAKVPADIVAVSWAAVRQLGHPREPQGVFRTERFRCHEDDALRAGRWALAESLGSFAPNTIVIGVDPEQELILAHQLRRTEGAAAIDILDLG